MYRLLAAAFREGHIFDVNRHPAGDSSLILTPAKVDPRTSTTFTMEAKAKAAAKHPIIVPFDNPNEEFEKLLNQ